MSELPKSIDRLDKLLLFCVGASFTVPSIVGAFDLDVRLVWGPVIFYAAWIIFKTVLPTIILSYPQRSIIERIRSWSYVFSLAVTFFTNYLLLVILPRTFQVFIGGVVAVGLMLRLVIVFVPRTFFKKEIMYMSKKQELEIYEILKDTGSASIFFSMGILILSVEFVDLEEFSVPKTVVTLAIAMALFTYAVYRERRSVKLARELADSLINSGWYKRYSSKSRKRPGS